jgi:hypothetical protein
MRTPLTAALLCLTLSHPAAAQLGFLEGVFNNVEHVGIGIVAARLQGETPLAPRGLRGFMVEVSFGAPATKRAPDAPAGQPRAIEIEFALGYGQLTGFGTGTPGYTLTGTVEELPAIVTYVAFRPDATVSPYIGLRTGITRLHEFRAYVGDDQQLHTATASTYLAGGSAGVAVGSDAVMLFVEGSLVYRRFPSVQWSGVGDQVPAVLPRTLPFTTAGVSVGVQVALKPGV